MAWKVELTEAAAKDFAALDGSLRKLARNKLGKLQENPFIGEELHNRPGCDLRGYYKLYFNGTRYRIVYRIENDLLLVLVTLSGCVGLRVTATTKCAGQTGVEMEALCAASTALLTVYDMCKAMDRGMRIENVQLEEKRGGKSGIWRRGSE